MQIAFVTKPHLPALGGAQMTTHLLARGLTARGHEVTVIAREPPAAAARLGYRVLRSRTPERELAGTDADVIVVGGYDRGRAGHTAAALAAASPRPVLLHLHDAGSASVAQRSAVVAVSRFLAAKVPGAAVVPPAIDAEDCRTHSSREVVLFVNPHPWKGVATVLDLARSRPDVPFALALCWRLDPAYLRRLRDRCRRLPNVEIRAPTSDRRRLYGDARLVLMPSVYPEAFGRVAVEAQLSAIPTVAAALGGLPEAVGEGGLLVDRAGGQAAWLEALSSAWDDPHAYSRLCERAARAGRRPQFSPAATAQLFERCLESAARRP